MLYRHLNLTNRLIHDSEAGCDVAACCACHDDSRLIPRTVKLKEIFVKYVPVFCRFRLWKKKKGK